MEDRGLECIQILIHLEQRAAFGIVGCYEELKNLGNFFNNYIGPSGRHRMIFNFNIKGNPNYGNEGRHNSRLAQ